VGERSGRMKRKSEIEVGGTERSREGQRGAERDKEGQRRIKRGRDGQRGA
jgi:hypothetical protein